MAEFKLTYGNMENVPETYLGEYDFKKSCYVFKKKDDHQEFKLNVTNSGVLLYRKGKDVIIEGELVVNRICELSLTLLDNSAVGKIPVLVRKIEINYPREIYIVYQLLDDKSVPCETIDILISENV